MAEEDLGTVRWFGRSWGAPINDPRTQIPTPQGVACQRCGRGIMSPDRGVTVPDARTGERYAWHLKCWLSTVVPDL